MNNIMCSKLDKTINSIKVSSFSLTIFFFTLTVVFLLSGCGEGALNTTPYGQNTSDNFWRNSSDAIAAINAVYDPLLSERLYGHTENTLTNIPDDDQYRAGDHSVEADLENFTFDASHSDFEVSWKNKYEIISRANEVLINVPAIEMDEVLKNRILGEAYFMRGFGYWTLAKLFGGVPLILEQEVIDSEYNKPRASLEETYAQIESDFLEATNLLPESYTGNNVGRAHSGTAWGFLAKLYMYQERFEDVIEAGSKVINGPYPLADSFGDNFKVETQYNSEILFTVGSTQGWNDQNHTIYTTPRPWGGWSFQTPLPNLVNSFEDGDPRKDYSIMMPGDVFDLGGDRGMAEYTADLSPTGYHFQKYAAWREEGGVDQSMNVPLLRASDVYLLVAEAKIRSGRNGDSEINAVRERASQDLKHITNATMEDLIHERRVELAGEGQRHLDLIRWDKAGIVDIVEIYGEDRGPYDPSRIFIRPKHYLYPIPQNQIDISGGVLEQNPEYD